MLKKRLRYTKGVRGLGLRPPSDGGSEASNATTRGAAIARTRTARIAVFGVRGVTWLCAVEKKGGKKKKNKMTPMRRCGNRFGGGAHVRPPVPPPRLLRKDF